MRDGSELTMTSLGDGRRRRRAGRGDAQPLSGDLMASRVEPVRSDRIQRPSPIDPGRSDQTV